MWVGRVERLAVKAVLRYLCKPRWEVSPVPREERMVEKPTRISGSFQLVSELRLSEHLGLCGMCSLEIGSVAP